ncbi:LAFE_0C05688g1_1 [Lachancea fermentati]|uniref:LAFE_0C05688g1_1 n=1 Tax=Lachancea fermentati TaxID=4955 RepID=A0A1G4M9H7_LACFM|nr:LAFE_0C05688g1_1 [Lachancea fermentati]
MGPAQTRAQRAARAAVCSVRGVLCVFVASAADGGRSRRMRMRCGAVCACVIVAQSELSHVRRAGRYRRSDSGQRAARGFSRGCSGTECGSEARRAPPRGRGAWVSAWPRALALARRSAASPRGEGPARNDNGAPTPLPTAAGRTGPRAQRAQRACKRKTGVCGAPDAAVRARVGGP